MDYMEQYLKHLGGGSINNNVEQRFFGVVEDIRDNLRIGRVRVRIFGIHPEDKTQVPTEDLPWAIVAQPTTSASISGVGWSPNGLELGTWVMGILLDGKDAQYPIVTHSISTIHRPNPPNIPGGSSAGYLTNQPQASGGNGPDPSAQRPYHNEVVETPQTTSSPDQGTSPGATPNKDPVLSPAPNSTAFGHGATTGTGAGGTGLVYLTLDNKNNWDQLGLPTYDWHPAPQGYACKDGLGSLRFHYATALALEALTKDYGKGKLYLNSAYRTPSYNAAQPGAAKHSQHMLGRALDISLGSIGSDQASIAKFAAMAVKRGFVGFGLYSSWLHCDTGSGRVWLGATADWFVSAITAAGWYHGKPGLSDVTVNPGAAANTAAAANTLNSNNTSGISNLNVKQGTVAYQIAQEAKAKGLNDAQTAVLIANAEHESSFRPDVTNSIGAYGLWQFYGDQKSQYLNYASNAGVNPSDVNTQTDYVISQLQNNNDFKNATTVDQANRGMYNYESFSTQSYDTNAEGQARAATANGYLNGGVIDSPSAASNKGFVDPTNSMPFPNYRGAPSTHVNALGFNSELDQQALFTKDNGRMTGMPAAGDIGTFGEPELAAAPQYPFNKVYADKAGNILEFDSTPGAERINLEGKSGSGYEIFADGSSVLRTHGNAFVTDYGDAYQGVMGKFFLTSINDMHIRSTADMIQHADGSLRIIVGNDGHMTISGDFALSVGEDIKIKTGNRLVIEAASIDFYSTGDINMEAVGGVNIKAGKDINYEATGNLYGKATTHYLDDVVRVGEGRANGNSGADTADVGPPPARSTISKNNFKTTTNMTKMTTTEDAASFYAQQKTA